VRSWTTQLILYCLAVATTVLAVISITNEALGGDKQLTAIMLILPIISALLGTISTRLRMREKFAQCKMASFEIVSEIYKYRVRALEYDPQSLARALMPKTDDKKKSDEDVVAPISNKDKDRLARQTFVQRVSMIYNNCMSSEMSKGTSIRHKTGVGMDPQRLLTEEDGEAAEETTRQLRTHVAKRLYKISVREWALGAQKVRAEGLADAHRAMAGRRRRLRRFGWKIMRRLTQVLMVLTISFVIFAFAIWGRIVHKVRKLRGIETTGGGFGSMLPLAVGGAKKQPEGADEEEEDALTKTANRAQAIASGIKNLWNRYFTEEVVAEDAIEEDIEGEDGEGGERKETLDPTYVDAEDLDDEGGGADGGGGKKGGAGGKSSLGIIRDNLTSTLTIEDYMTYRAKPITTYVERTAPWRAFQLQCIEIFVFTINSSGAVLVGVSEPGLDLVPYVAITVGVAAVCNSYLEFSRLAKQVEAYNQGQRELHTLINEWDSLTSTERRTSARRQKIVSTVETAHQRIAEAITDASATGEGGEGGGEGDGDGEGEGEAA
jgi:hypothetical protein